MEFTPFLHSKLKVLSSTLPMLIHTEIDLTSPEQIETIVVKDVLLSSVDAGYLQVTIAQALDRYSRHTSIVSSDKVISITISSQVNSVYINDDESKSDDMYEMIWFDDKDYGNSVDSVSSVDADAVVVIVIVVFITGMVVGIMISILCTKAPPLSLMESSSRNSRATHHSSSSPPEQLRRPSLFTRRSKGEL